MWDAICVECGVTGFEKDLTNWHQKRTGCNGSIISRKKYEATKVETRPAEEAEVSKPGTGQVRSPSGKDRATEKVARFDRNAYQRKYMKWVRGGRIGKFEP